MNNRTRIKICGVKSNQDAHAAAYAGADAVGLVFVDSSPRFVSPQHALDIVKHLPPFIHTVGLFSSLETDVIRDQLAIVKLSMIQLHGGHDTEIIHELDPIPTLKALPFDPINAEKNIRHWDAAYKKLRNLKGLILDTPHPTQQGGTGKSFDWHALKEILNNTRPEIPIILAGGLNAQNVQDAIDTVTPWAVDVSSGVESARGIKDHEKISEFCRNVRNTTENK